MRLSRNVTIFVTAVAAAFASAPAEAAPSPSGVLCGFNHLPADPDSGVRTAWIEGGPMLWTDGSDPTVTYSGYITCTIWNGGVAVCRISSPQTAVVAYGAGTCTYAADQGDVLSLCTEVTVGGVTLYPNEGQDPLDDDAWTTEPGGCVTVTSVETGGVLPV